MCLGVNMLLALLRAHFSSLATRAKMSLSQAKNRIFTPANINSLVILLSSMKLEILSVVIQIKDSESY